MSDYRLLIDGKLVAGDLEMDVINPATEEVLARCPRGSASQMEAAIVAAKRAFKGWAHTPIDERKAMVLKLADAVDARGEELARLLVQEQGKPLAEAEAEISYTALFLRFFTTMELETKIIEDSDEKRVEQRRKPLGVVGCILPWNFPILLLAFKLPAALIAGNSVVIKPAPTTPLTTLRLGELCADIFPAGVINIVTDQNDLGGQMTAHPDIAKISFTGSTATGKKVMAGAASSIKRITLELGGNDAAIVMPDADPKAVAPGIFGAATMNAGQVCLAVKRVYAHDSIYDALCDELAKLADATIVDDGLKQGSQMGPLQNKMQYDKVKEFIDDARANGNIIAGGVIEDRKGYFIRPTIVRDVTDGTRIVDDEQFGPVLPIIRYSDVDEALERANASPWGLGGSIWGKDREKAYALAGEMEVGAAWINKHLDFGPHIPFGGAKQSGIGSELAQEGLNEFTQLQIINEAKQPLVA